MPIPPAKSSALHHLVVVKLNVHNPILGDRLDRHALKVYWQPPLELVRAHVEDLDALVERDVGVVVLVEDGQAVVSGQGASAIAQGQLGRETHTGRSHGRHRAAAPTTRGSPASRGWACG